VRGLYRCGVLLAGFLAPMCFGTWADETKVRVILLPITEPRAINNNGAVAGVGGEIPNRGGVVLDQGRRDLPFPSSRGGGSFIAAINSSGTAAGYYWGLSGTSSISFLWSKGVGTELASLGSAYISGINDAGDVVGARSGQAFVYRDGVAANLGTLGGSYSAALAINNLGVIVGESSTGAGLTHAFRFENGVMTDLGTLGGGTSQALAVNDAGVVVGWAETSNGELHPAMFKDGAVIDLGQPGCPQGAANAINEAGTICGVIKNSAGSRPFVFDADGWHDLGPLLERHALHNCTLTGINDLGQIVGYGTLSALRGGASGFLITREARPPDPVILQPDGFAFSLVTNGSTGAPRFNFPQGLARRGDGAIIVADYSNGSLRSVDASGKVETLVRGLRGPTGLVISSDGWIFVSERSGHCISIVKPDGGIVTLAGKPGQSGAADGSGDNARFNTPEGMLLDSDGSILVADASNHAIRRVTRGGDVTTVAGGLGVSGTVDGPADQARFYGPRSLARGRDGALYVADQGNYAIRRVGEDGVVSTYAGALGLPGSDDGQRLSARFVAPAVIAPAGEGGFWIAEPGTQWLRRISTEGDVSIVAGTEPDSLRDQTVQFPLSAVHGLMEDENGVLWIADSGNSVIRRFRDGKLELFAGVKPHPSSGIADGTGAAFPLAGSEDVAVDRWGNLFVCDALHVVRKRTPDGVETILAGKLGEPGAVDGPGATARFRMPVGLCTDYEGNVYVADRLNFSIRKIDRTGNVTTVAGKLGVAGKSDGPLGEGRLFGPVDLTADRAGNIFLIDSGGVAYGYDGAMVRRISPDGMLTTIAGKDTVGIDDGPVSQARLYSPVGIAVNDAGVIYVLQTSPGTIRRISPDGWLDTFVGPTGTTYAVDVFDGVGAQAGFSLPQSLAIDPGGNLFVADALWATVALIRRVTPDGVVSTVTDALASSSLSADAAFYPMSRLLGITAAEDGSVYAVSSLEDSGLREWVYRGTPASVPVVSLHADSENIRAGDPLVLRATVASPGSYRFQWYNDGQPVAGATSDTLVIPAVQAFHSSQFTVSVASELAGVRSAPFQFSAGLPAQSGARLLNLSTRALCLTGDDVLIPGFYIEGSGTKRLLMRAVGPELKKFGVSLALADPHMILKRMSDGAVVATNDNWGDNANWPEIRDVARNLYAFGLTEGSTSAALLMDLPAGGYSIVASGQENQAGVSIVELYDASESSDQTRLVNISNRGYVDVGGNIMIPGFVVSEEGSRTFLIRAVGPTLSRFSVPGVLADPKIEVYKRRPGTAIDDLILTNDTWGENGDAEQIRQTASALHAFGLTEGSADAAFVVTLPPGAYTVNAKGVGDTTGVALVEVYLVP